MKNGDNNDRNPNMVLYWYLQIHGEYRRMRHGSLFSGIGGFDLAAEWMGWTNVFHCEWNEFGQKILKHYWPDAISYDDICKTDFTIHRGTIDILTGGFPCQPYSVAGKRKGTEDARHLWPEMLRAIRECRPTWIVGENVPGLINWSKGLVFEQVCADLESEGYEVQPVVLPACGVNAPHKRERIWFVAYSEHLRNSQVARTLQGESERHGLEYEHKIYKPCKSNNVREFSANGTKVRLQNGIKAANTGNIEGKFRRFDRKSCISGWEQFPVVAPVCDGDDGFPYKLDSITFSKFRSESIQAGGNAIVPQVALQIFKVIEQMESN
jgi:DNA (cytosine-5)-methyltransferase 1